MKSTYFQNEIKCHCGCNTAKVSPFLIKSLDNLRRSCGWSIKANSICRCVQWNYKIGGSPTSSHISTVTRYGMAADLRLPFKLWKILKLLYFCGKYFDRCGINIRKWFVHVDVDEDKPDVFWIYKKAKKKDKV